MPPEDTTSGTLWPLASLLLSLVQWVQAQGFTRWVALYSVLALGLGGLCKYPWEIPGVALRLMVVALVALLEYVERGCKPLFEEWTLSFEIVRAVVRSVGTHYALRTMVPRNAQFVRLQTRVAGAVLGTFTCWQHGTETERFQFNGLNHIWVRLKKEKTNTASFPGRRRRRCVLLYFHGGGYAILSPRYYVSSTSELLVRIQAQLDKMSTPDDVEIEVEVLLANYRKTPEHPYPTPANDAHAMYRYLLDVERVAPQDILIVGDSAGAGLSLATMLRVRDKNAQELPCGAIFSCPYVDLEMRGDQRRVPYCVMVDNAVNVVPQMYVPWGGCPATWGDASPLHCNLSGLPQVYIIAGEFDYLLPQSQRLLARAREDGVTDWKLDIHTHMVHVFMHVPPFVLPYASRGLDAMAAFAAEKLLQRGSQRANGAIGVAASA